MSEAMPKTPLIQVINSGKKEIKMTPSDQITQSEADSTDIFDFFIKNKIKMKKRIENDIKNIRS